MEMLTDGGSTKPPRANGSLMKTVYDGSVDITDLDVLKMVSRLTMILYRRASALR